MVPRASRSTLFPYTDALPILARGTGKDADVLKNGSHAGPVARRGAHLQPHTGEEIGHPVVIFLRPLGQRVIVAVRAGRSEEHTSELQSHSDLVCRLLLEKKKA